MIQNKHIGFNKPYLTGKEMHYMYDAVQTGKISGNGKYTQLCHNYFESTYGFGKCLLTTSCTDALEMAALLLNIQPGDEVIAPSYTFVSTVNAFVLRGAKIVFVDSDTTNPNMDVTQIEALITKKTRVIIPVHYAGIACDMETIMDIANRYKLFVVEDAAQAIDSYYIDSRGNKKALGSIGHLATFSFHETKNIISGEGGMLVINDSHFFERSEIIWEKGTNRSAFFRGEIDKYGWVDIGSSFLPSETIAAFLWAQIEHLNEIQKKRIELWDTYYSELKNYQKKGLFKLPFIPIYATNNAHMFYLTFESLEERIKCIKSLKKINVHAVFHYQSLHRSPYYKMKHDDRTLAMSDIYSDTLLRLPMYYELTSEDIHLITRNLISYE